MTNYIFNLEKQAHLLSGGERARLVIKDDFQKTYGDQKGFLNELEKQALLNMTDRQVKEEYETLWKIYEQMPLTMANITESYLRFKYYFEALKKAHLLLNMSPAISYLSKLIEENIVNEDAKKGALKVVDMIQVLDTNSLDKPAFKEVLSFVKEIVTKASKQVQHFISMKKTVDRTNEAMGFSIFMYEHYDKSCKIFAEEIKLCIREHNRIMNSSGEGMLELNDYLISEPTP